MLAYETPLSILMRRFYNQRPKLRSEFFGTEMTPSIVQYDPRRRHFDNFDRLSRFVRPGYLRRRTKNKRNWYKKSIRRECVGHRFAVVK